ncbi:Putative ribonuclease H protein At1g65750 [Linum perenne]
MWKSIYASQVILRRGIRWKIGDGESIRVWNSPWLHDELNFKVETPPFAGSEEYKVKELFVCDGLVWDVAKVQLLFGERDWKEILSIPGGCRGRRDELVWHFGKDGKYSVRSGYHVLMERIVDLSYLQVNGDWQKLWKVDLPPRMLNFVWRLAREILPTRAVLQRRGLIVPFECGICTREPEEAWHVFITCDFETQCWRKAGLIREVERAMQDMESCSEWVLTS